MVEEQSVSEVKPITQEQANSPGKKLGLMARLGIMKIPVLFIMVIILAVGTAFIVTKMVDNKAKTKLADSTKASKTNKVGKFISLEAFTVNLAGGQNYLQTVIALEVKAEDAELEAEVKERKPQINDSIIAILSAKTIDDISDNAGRDSLKIEIKKAVDSLLSYGKIERVYFTTFIMQ